MRKHVKAEFDGEKLKAVIKQKGLTQKDFAEMAGVTVGTLSHVLGGIRKPSVTLNKVICLTLGVPEDEFLVEPEPPKPEPPEQTQDSTAVAAVNESTDKLIVQLDRMERKLDRLEMLIRSVQNENLALRQALIKRK